MSGWAIAVVGVLALCCRAYGESVPPSVELSRLDSTPLLERAEYWVADRGPGLAMAEQATYRPLDARAINQGISDQVYWVRVRLNNADQSSREWVLTHETTYLDNIEVYYRDAGERAFEHQRLSDRVPFSERPVDYRKLSFSHRTPGGSHTDLYLKVYYDKADSVSLQFTLYEQSMFERMVREENLLFGGYYGILLVLTLIALIVGTVLRRTSVYTYALFLAATGFQWLMINGYGYQYLWPDSVYWHNEGFHVSYLAFCLLACEFSKAFLRTDDRFPSTHRLLQGLQLVALGGIGLRWLGLYVPVLHLTFALLTVVAITIPVISWRAWRQGVRYARWYVFAWSIYSVSLMLSIASAYLNLVPWGMQSLTLLQLGSLLEAVMLTVAMSERLLSVEAERRKAVELANKDPLTGLGNRRQLQKQYEKFRAQYTQDRVPVFLIMIDLDHFKVVNDTYGHDAGDQVLKEVASLLQVHCRTNDVCIRYGGEEFALLLRAEGMDSVWRIAERIRQEFAQQATNYLDQRIEHTLSSGITSVLEGDRLLSVNQMMKYADKALYQGKAAGRNCSIIYREGATEPNQGSAEGSHLPS